MSNNTNATDNNRTPLTIGTDSSFAAEVDETFDAASRTGPTKSWAPAQEALLDEIGQLEGVANPTPAQQLRILELKLQFIGTTGRMSDVQLQPYLNTVGDLQTRLNTSMGVAYDDFPVMGQLLSDLSKAGVSVEGSSLQRKYQALYDNPNLNLSARIQFAAEFQRESASLYAEGSARHTNHSNRANYLTTVAEKLIASEGRLGSITVADLEQITFGDLKALDEATLRDEADFFRELAQKREVEIRTSMQSSEYSEAQINAAISADPLIRYFNGRAGIAEKAANALVGGASPMDRVRIGMDYFSDVAKADHTFYKDAATLAANNGDDANKVEFETLASEASDRLGVINRIAQTLMSMMSQAITDAVRG